MKASIVKGTGKYAKQFRFILYGKNGRVIATGEHYTRISNCKKTLLKYFPEYKVTEVL